MKAEERIWQSLRRPPFTDDDTEALADKVYDYVWQRSASGISWTGHSGSASQV